MKRCIFGTENICSVYLEDLFIELVPALAKLPADLAGGVGLEKGGAGRAGGDSDGWSSFSAGGAGMCGVKAGRAGGDSDDWLAFSAEGASMAGGDTGRAMGLAGDAGLESGLAGRAGGGLDDFSARDAGLAWGGPVVAFFNLKIINYQTFANIYCLN